MKKIKCIIFTLFILCGFSNLLHAQECNLSDLGDCGVLNNHDAPAASAGRYYAHSLREMIRSACTVGGNNTLNFDHISPDGTGTPYKTITLSRGLGPLIIGKNPDGSACAAGRITVQGPTTGDPVIIDVSAFNTFSNDDAYPTCAIVLAGDGNGLRNIEIRGGVNSVCIEGNGNSVSFNTLVNDRFSAIRVNGASNQVVGNYVGVYSSDLADSSHGGNQMGILGAGNNNRIEANTIKFNSNAGIAWFAGTGNRFLQNIIAQNGIGIGLQPGVHNGIQPPIVNSACAERDTAGACDLWNVSVTGVANASVDIYKVDTCWPDASDPSCTANAGRGQGEGIKLLSTNVTLSAGDPPSPGCVALADGKVRCTVNIADPELTGTDKITAIQTTNDGSSEFGINIPLNNSTLLIPDAGFALACLLNGTCGFAPNLPTCGDGIVNQASEVCDGEVGCTALCQPATGYTCTQNPPDAMGQVHSTCTLTVTPSCGNGTCDPGETYASCPADCPAPLPVCGDGTCNGTETHATCPADCPTPPPVCGDGTCNGTETHATCPADCPAPLPVCGDGTCNGTETHATCPADCPAPPPTCGNGTCDATETASSCPADCVPNSGCNFNGTCDIGETVSSCAHDCTVGPGCNRNGTCDVGETTATCASDCVVTPNCNRDGICNSGETLDTCASDCTGVTSHCNNNGVCDAGETNATCPLECPVTPTCNNNGTCDAGETLANCPSDCSPPTGLNPPTELTAQVAPGQVTLRFKDNSTTEEGYRITRAQGECGPADGTGVRPNTDFTTVGTIPSANPSSTGPVEYVDSAGVANNTIYCYRVTAFQGTNSTSFAQVQVSMPDVGANPGGGNPPPAGEDIDVQGGGCSMGGAFAYSGSPLGFSGFALGLLVLIRRQFKRASFERSSPFSI
ncbi:MAG: hypothetical protein HQM15_06950 [Deltaproteobacteria bacterium]|nr:hypothetical protein [Deltaproteobacteria bacterium]